MATSRGCTLADGECARRCHKGEAYRAFVGRAGRRWPATPRWAAGACRELLNAALYEMLAAASHAWTMYPGLLHGAYGACTCMPAELKTALPRQGGDGRWLSTIIA